MKRALLILGATLLAAPLAHGQYALQFGASVAVSGDQIIAGQGRNLLLPGTVYVYAHTDGSWSLMQQIEGEGEAASGFGRALAADGNVLAIGAPLAGEVHLFGRSEAGAWSRMHTLAAEAEGFGSAVAVAGDHLLVGTDNSGALAYRNEDGGWQPAGTLSIDEIPENAGFGSVVALDGSTAVVAAPSLGARAGAAYAYAYASGAWQPAEALESPSAESGRGFGSAAAVSGGTIAVGASEGVDLFARNEEGAWAHVRKLTAFDAERTGFGAAVAFSGDALLVGAPNADNGQGAVYAFNQGADQVRTVRPQDAPFRARFGAALAASEDLAAAGSVGYDNFEGAVFAIATGANPEVSSPLFDDTGEMSSVTGSMMECEEGEAGAYPCAEIDMLSFLTRREIGARRGIQVNDVWGWEDPETGKEYALVGRTDGTSFIDMSDPYHPRYLGDLPKTATANQSLWRDIKVYKDHAFVVADGAGAHHVQIFDLRQLRGLGDEAPVTFQETAIYKGVYSSHNIIINEETGYAYAVGNDSGGETCGGALHMINIQDPVNPVFAGCFNDPRTGRGGSGATHDAQCVSYVGPDSDYVGHEICLSSNGTALSIADVTDKENPVAIAVAEYPNVAYTHQGWLTDDHRYFYLNDEGDEVGGLVSATRTLIFDLEDLDDPALAGEYLGPTSAIDHNLYIQGTTMYQTNYVEGLRLVDISDPENPVEVGHFDTVPYGPNDNSPVLGAWSNYPYFKSGVIVVTSGREGVFFLKRKTVDT